MSLEEIVSLFPGGRWHSGEYTVLCPCHKDTKPSLSFGPGKNGGVVICCGGGCDTATILDSKGLSLKDLAPPSVNGNRPPEQTVYRYDDEQGNPLYEVHRTADKAFFARLPGATTGGIGAVRRVLFGLPELLKSSEGDIIAITEGEKDVLTLRRCDLFATCNVGGASQPNQKTKWREEYSHWLRDYLPRRRFAIFPDNDEAGRAHGAAVLNSLVSNGLDAFIVQMDGLPEKGDVTDWMESHSQSDLVAILIPSASKQDPFVASVATFSQSAKANAPVELQPEALHGLPGKAVQAIAPCTESSSAAVLASFLVGAGCLIGRGPHIYRDGAYHGVNEFACLVGLTSTGRKGTATRRAEEILTAVGDVNNISQRDILSAHDMHEARAKSWRELLLPGLGSGEALVSTLADAARAGDPCPRRLVIEEEFSKPLRIMQREGSTLSETLRAAWDGSILANVTKARTLRVASSHVAILAHITEAEMKLRLGAAEMFNGFANRFLWICTQRARSLPFGGGDAPIGPVVTALRQAVIQSRLTKRVEFDAAAKRIWDQGGVYDLLISRPNGLLGAVTSRAEVHVTRLSLLYALLDSEIEVRVPHLLAALALWDFSEKSAAYLFGESTGDDYADIILELLQDVYPGGMTRTEIRDRFSRHAAPGRIPAALALLERQGKVERVVIDTGGRPTEYWRGNGEKSCDQSDKSPLEVARGLL